MHPWLKKVTHGCGTAIKVRKAFCRSVYLANLTQRALVSAQHGARHCKRLWSSFSQKLLRYTYIHLQQNCKLTTKSQMNIEGGPENKAYLSADNLETINENW